MKSRTLVPLLIVCGLFLNALATGEEIPKGWFKAGSNPKDYEASLDRDVTYKEKPSASIKNTAATPAGFATLMQMARADAYRGKRVRFTGYVQSKEIAKWAGMWLRIDGPKGEPLGFDNMEKRPIKGTTGWTKCEIVLDVPQNAKEMAFGMLLAGPGQIWMAGLNFATVGQEVPTTGSAASAGVQPAPTNLSFDK